MRHGSSSARGQATRMNAIPSATRRRRGVGRCVAMKSANGAATTRNAPNTFGSPKIDASRATSPNRPRDGSSPRIRGDRSAWPIASTAEPVTMASIAPIAYVDCRSEKPTSRGRKNRTVASSVKSRPRAAMRGGTPLRTAAASAIRVNATSATVTGWRNACVRRPSSHALTTITSPTARSRTSDRRWATVSSVGGRMSATM